MSINALGTESAALTSGYVLWKHICWITYYLGSCMLASISTVMNTQPSPGSDLIVPAMVRGARLEAQTAASQPWPLLVLWYHWAEKMIFHNELQHPCSYPPHLEASLQPLLQASISTVLRVWSSSGLSSGLPRRPSPPHAPWCVWLSIGHQALECFRSSDTLGAQSHKIQIRLSMVESSVHTFHSTINLSIKCKICWPTAKYNSPGTVRCYSCHN